MIQEGTRIEIVSGAHRGKTGEVTFISGSPSEPIYNVKLDVDGDIIFLYQWELVEL